MSEKRRDHRGRILHNGEIQLSDGRYRFKYVDEMGKERCVYSWRLDHKTMQLRKESAVLCRFERWRRKFRWIISNRLQQMAEI